MTQALATGTILHGRQDYRIERVLGRGGFGITYEASTLFRLGSLTVRGKVCVKEHFLGDHSQRGTDAVTVVCPGTDSSRSLVASSLKDFIAEARRLAGLNGAHDNIVKVNEVFEAHGTAYYVMEYLEGESLWSYVCRKGALGRDELRRLLTPIVSAVACLHRERLTHLDIKPDNIMLADDHERGIRPVLIDFGLSKHYDSSGTPTSTINVQGVSNGFSPAEQYIGINSFSPQSDVYSLGATMLACATGRVPEAAVQWTEGEPGRTIAALSLDDNLKSVMTKAMKTSRDSRYADAGAMLAALQGKELPKRSEPIRTPAATVPLQQAPAPPKDKPEPAAPAVGVRRAPAHLDFALMDKNGVIDFIDKGGFNQLDEERKYNDVFGIVIIDGPVRFIWQFTEFTTDMSRREALENFGNSLPDRTQAEALKRNAKAISAVLKTYLPESYWKNKFEYRAFHTSEGMNSHDRLYYMMSYINLTKELDIDLHLSGGWPTAAVIPVMPLPGESYAELTDKTLAERFIAEHRGAGVARELDLCVLARSLDTLYLSREDFENPYGISRGEMTVCGIVLGKGENRFLFKPYTLNHGGCARDYDTSRDDARREHGSLPTEEQALEILNNKDAINDIYSVAGNIYKLERPMWTQARSLPFTHKIMNFKEGKLRMQRDSNPCWAGLVQPLRN